MSLLEDLERIRVAAAAFCPELHPGQDCATLAEAGARTEKAIAALVARCAARAISCH